MISTEDLLWIKKHKQFKSKRMEMIYHANSNQKWTGVAILILDKIDFKAKIVIRAKKDILSW